MATPIVGTSPNIKWGLMDGVPVGVYESLYGEGKQEVDLAKFPKVVSSFIRGVKNNLSQIFYRGRSFISFHCRRRRYKISYVVEELGTCGWHERVVLICPVCGDEKGKIREDLSGVPF